MNVTPFVNSLFFFSILTKVPYSLQNLVKHCIINCTKVRPVGPSGYMETDRHDESNSRFSQLHERAQKPVPMQPKFYVDCPGIKSDLCLERLVANCLSLGTTQQTYIKTRFLLSSYWSP
jgi:hypothetical protein